MKQEKKKNIFQKELFSLCQICVQLVPKEIVVTKFIEERDGHYQTLFKLVLLLNRVCIG
jgi:hypothetical protein